MALKDFPAIADEFDRLSNLKITIRAESAALRARRDALITDIQALQVKETALIARIKEIEQPIAEIDAKMSVLARAAGGKTLSGA
jgi:predicted  nucleic acid-binding Zn-ribbon protein